MLIAMHVVDIVTLSISGHLHVHSYVGKEKDAMTLQSICGMLISLSRPLSPYLVRRLSMCCNVYEFIINIICGIMCLLFSKKAQFSMYWLPGTSLENRSNNSQSISLLGRLHCVPQNTSVSTPDWILRGGLSLSIQIGVEADVFCGTQWVTLSFRNTKVLHQTLNPTAELWCKI